MIRTTPGFFMTRGQEHIASVVKALKVEREGEFARFKGLVKDVAVSELKLSAACWYPLKEIKRGYGIASNPWLLVTRNPGDDIATELKPGQPVAVFGESREDVVQGIILDMDHLQMKVGLNADEVPDWIDEMKFGVMEYFDPKSFDEMEKALSHVLNAEKGRLKELREIFHGDDTASFVAGSRFESTSLNPSQINAVNQALDAQDISIIHGPPGTGKTTTLVEVVREFARSEVRILVCAPSNAAVDLLTTKIAEAEVSVLRIGRLARIKEDALEYSLDLAIQKSKEYQEAESYRRQAKELFSKARKFKRSFGPEERKQRAQLFQEAKDLKRTARKVESFAITKSLEQASVITCTLVGSASRYLEDFEFDTVIIDEAGQALEPSTWIPIIRAKKVILAGDPFQLPPTVKTPEAEKMGLGKSLLELLSKHDEWSTLLNVQYRMNTIIMGFSSEWFYNGELRSADAVADHNTDGQPLEFIDTAGCGFAEEGDMSKWNLGELDILQKHLNSTNTQGCSIGIISPYAEQVRRLEMEISKRERMTVQTVDSFQGQERDIIYISLVRNNEDGHIGFLKDYRRMNVAMTRARKKLVVIGDSVTIGQDPFYSAFLDYCERHNAYKSAWEYLN